MDGPSDNLDVSGSYPFNGRGAGQSARRTWPSADTTATVLPSGLSAAPYQGDGYGSSLSLNFRTGPSNCASGRRIDKRPSPATTSRRAGAAPPAVSDLANGGSQARWRTSDG